MPGLFSRLSGRDGKKKKTGLNDDNSQMLPKKRWEDAWARTSVEPEEIQELIRRCTEDLKSRALDLPFFLLPFRPTSNPSAVRTFIRRFFDPSIGLKGDNLVQELRMTDPMVICGIVKWCWSRMSGGVVGWGVYELFKVGEKDSGLARDSFKTFIPLSAENGAKSCIIFDFFDLLSAIAAHAKLNGMGGRKLSRMASWWTFEHKDTGSGFDGGYKVFLDAADATSHLFFAYLRSLAPSTPRAGISILPMSMQKLLEETEYPPQRPSLLQYRTHKISMHVDAVSPTPFALLRRAKHFQFRDTDKGLKAYSEFEDPIMALTEECRRVLKAISSINQSQVSSSKISTSLRDASWSRFEDLGFSTTMDETDEDEDKAVLARRPPVGLRTNPASGSAVNLGRPTTPSWADFMSSGFDDSANGNAPNLLLPPDKVLPPIETTVRQHSSQSHQPRLESDFQAIEPGELASISAIELDDCFWWVWISSLGPEETAIRKSSFGRCAVIETEIKTARWLVIEELVAGAGPDLEEGAYIAEKKGFFSWTRRGRLNRSKSTATKPNQDKSPGQVNQLSYSKTSIGPDQQARIQAAAAQLQAKQNEERQKLLALPTRRGRTDSELLHEKTNSMMTMQTALVSEASSALKWARKYDKDTIRSEYMNNSQAGKGQGNLDVVGSQPGPSSVSIVPTVSKELPQERVQTPEPVAIEPVVSAPPKPSTGVKPVPTLKNSTVAPSESKKTRKLQKVSVAENHTIIPSPTTEKAPSSGGGLKKLFSRRNRSSKLPENAAAEVNNMRKQAGKPLASPTSIKEASIPAPISKDVPGPTPETVVEPDHLEISEPVTVENTEPTIPDGIPVEAPIDAAPSPVVSPLPKQDKPKYEPSDDDINTDDANEARQEFSRFDQGPLVDQPACVPESDSDDAAPPPIPRHARTPEPAAASKPKSTETNESRAEFEDERWARLRRNAQERALQRQRQHPPKPRPAPVTRTSDMEDDTSGEETIESRVARIKARVAELTGNMEGVGSPGVMASPRGSTDEANSPTAAPLTPPASDAVSDAAVASDSNVNTTITPDSALGCANPSRLSASRVSRARRFKHWSLCMRKERRRVNSL
ncbi:hypothetical protein Cpir12675_003153 [Ceratocystis pirilliformis]|uniref:Meiotically up-regulated protein Msb1/Mug8 domain-containing protein n=1 Tax=Ceratocystis pirilliformis TaxID=259994 RepID=A0ABR3Z4L0_9PEZI